MTAKFFKTSTDISLYYCWTVVLLNIITKNEIAGYHLPCILVLLGALILNLSDSDSITTNLLEKAGKILGIIIPATALIWFPIKYAVFLLLLPWFYYVFSFFTDRQNIRHQEFRKRFRTMSISMVAIPIIAIYISDFDGLVAIMRALPWFIIFLASGILELQNLRWKGNSHGKDSYDKKQLLDLILFCGVALITALTDYISKLTVLFLTKVVRPFLSYTFGAGLASVYTGMLKLEALVPQRPLSEIEEEMANYVEESTPEGYLPPPVSPEQITIDNSFPRYQINPLIVVGILAVIIILIMLLNKRTNEKIQVVPNELREKIIVPREKKKQKAAPSDTIRSLYRKHMRKVYSKTGLSISDTTEDIALKAISSGIQSESEERLLTERYRNARYGGRS